jgi:hypothetical protein
LFIHTEAPPPSEPPTDYGTVTVFSASYLKPVLCCSNPGGDGGGCVSVGDNGVYTVVIKINLTFL